VSAIGDGVQKFKNGGGRARGERRDGVQKFKNPLDAGRYAAAFTLKATKIQRSIGVLELLNTVPVLAGPRPFLNF
jgi:hypothetical protein